LARLCSPRKIIASGAHVDRSGSRVARWAAIARGVLRVSARCAQWLALPLALLLFLQWPLREWLHAYSREANDLAQILFALYVAVAVGEAMRRRAHVAADAFVHHFSERTRAMLARAGALLVLVPWCTFVLYAVAPMAWNALRHTEAFAETLNPGYFVIKLAVVVLAALVLLQALLDIVWPQHVEPES
jgi:TRAP-type mannitol/chloroaromatic compound transport system permease small subunit